MTTSPIEHSHALAQRVSVTSDKLSVDLADGRTISVPLDWYPRLMHASVTERNTWQITGAAKVFIGPRLMKT